VPFQGHGWIRPFYFVLLGTYTTLAIVMVPLILITLRRAWLERFDKHRIIARWTLPLWLYVSVTGVIVYLMVYQIYRAPAGQTDLNYSQRTIQDESQRSTHQ
jgi:putative membrane protein